MCSATVARTIESRTRNEASICSRSERASVPEFSAPLSQCSSLSLSPTVGKLCIVQKKTSPRTSFRIGIDVFFHDVCRWIYSAVSFDDRSTCIEKALTLVWLGEHRLEFSFVEKLGRLLEIAMGENIYSGSKIIMIIICESTHYTISRYYRYNL